MDFCVFMVLMRVGEVVFENISIGSKSNGVGLGAWGGFPM